MSVVIPNMKMPMSCLACPLAREMFGCLVCVGYFKDNLTGRRVYKSDLNESDTDFNRPDWCPIEPIVSCNECRYYYKDSDGYEMCDNSEGYDHISADGFCAWAERRLDNG